MFVLEFLLLTLVVILIEIEGGGIGPFLFTITKKGSCNFCCKIAKIEPKNSFFAYIYTKNEKMFIFWATKKKFWVSAEQFGPDDLSFLLLHWIELIAGYNVSGSDFGEKFFWD